MHMLLVGNKISVSGKKFSHKRQAVYVHTIKTSMLSNASLLYVAIHELHADERSTFDTTRGPAS